MNTTIDQAAIVVAAHRRQQIQGDSGAQSAWRATLSPSYSIVGPTYVRSKEHKAGLVGGLVRAWTSEQTRQQQLQKAIDDTVEKIFKALDVKEPRSSSFDERGWPFVGRWIACMPDAGSSVLKILAGAHSSPHQFSFDALEPHDLVAQLSALAREHLDLLVSERSQFSCQDVWSRLVDVVVHKQTLEPLDRMVVAEFFRCLNAQKERVWVTDLVVALWSYLGDGKPQQIIQNYYELARYLSSLEDGRWLLSAQKTDELQFRSEEFLFYNKHGQVALSDQSIPFMHPSGFVPLINLLHQGSDRVIDPPKVLRVGPFVNFAEVLLPDLAWSAWRQEWLEQDAVLTDKLQMVAGLFTRGIAHGLMPNFDQMPVESLAFLADKLTAFHSVPWKAFNFFELEAFIWNFCEGKMEHYEVFMAAMEEPLRQARQEQVRRLEEMIKNRGCIQADWLRSQHCDFHWFQKMRLQVKEYLRLASQDRRLSAEQIIEWGAWAVNQGSHPLRASAKEWLALVYKELDAAQHTATVPPSPVRKPALAAAGAASVEPQVPLDQATLQQLLATHRAQIEELLAASDSVARGPAS